LTRTSRRRSAAQAPRAAAALSRNDYKDDSVMACRPGRKGDACDVDLTTTVVPPTAR
jgi:hypothetical protein